MTNSLPISSTLKQPSFENTTCFSKLKNVIDEIYQQFDQLNLEQFNSNIVSILNDVIDLLDRGKLRVAEKNKGNWYFNEWVRKALHLYHFYYDSETLDQGGNEHANKMPLKAEDFSINSEYRHDPLRLQQVIRKGAYIHHDTIIMPAAINFAAYIDSGTMIEANAKIGACAQIGKNVHIASGVGIGGVMAPIDMPPVIIEDNCYIGAHTEIQSGVIVEQNSIINKGVYLDATTRIYDSKTGQTYYGRVPEGSIVIAGNMPNRDGKSSVYCAIIVKQIDYHEQSIALNDLIKDHRPH